VLLSKKVLFLVVVSHYIRAISSLEGLKGENEDETTGIEIVKRAIEEPLRQIVAMPVKKVP
jgi:chaperonin GroEL (HSP60 family)